MPHIDEGGLARNPLGCFAPDRKPNLLRNTPDPQDSTQFCDERETCDTDGSTCLAINPFPRPRCSTLKTTFNLSPSPSPPLRPSPDPLTQPGARRGNPPSPSPPIPPRAQRPAFTPLGSHSIQVHFSLASLPRSGCAAASRTPVLDVTRPQQRAFAGSAIPARAHRVLINFFLLPSGFGPGRGERAGRPTSIGPSAPHAPRGTRRPTVWQVAPGEKRERRRKAS
jgi:hypothetical protein